MKKYLPELYDHFKENGIFVEMYASDWVFCLFSSIIPLAMYADFLDQFFYEGDQKGNNNNEGGWLYFYRLCLSLLTYFKTKLLEEEEISGILYHIKFKSPEK